MFYKEYFFKIKNNTQYHKLLELEKMGVDIESPEFLAGIKYARKKRKIGEKIKNFLPH